MRFIRPVRGSRDPRQRLNILLQSLPEKSNSLTQAIDAMYLQIVEDSLGQERDKQLLEQFRQVVGTILLAFSRSTVGELASLLRLPSITVASVLEELHSVLIVPEHGTIQAIHPSFRDFITNKSRCRNENFLIDTAHHHQLMTLRCLERMASLKRNLCDIEPSLLNSQVLNLDERVSSSFPGDLKYACSFWAYHLRECDEIDNLFIAITTFSFSKLLYWIEALSLLSDVGGGVRSLQIARAKLSLTPTAPPQLSECFHDAERFMREFFELISSSAMHIYQSALPFTPKKTALYKAFGFEAEQSPKVRSGMPDTWSSCLQVMEEHIGVVNCVAISKDGNRIASASGDRTVRIWDTHTGACLQRLDGHWAGVCSVCFSNDNRRIISGSDDRTIKIWDSDAGECLNTLRAHTASVTSVIITADGTQLISGSRDKTVRLWNFECGDCSLMLTGHSDTVTSVAVTKDGSKAFSGSRDCCIRIWNITGGECTQILEGHTDDVTALSVLDASLQLVSGSQDQSVRLWDVIAGSCLHVLHLSSIGHVWTVAGLLWNEVPYIACGGGRQSVTVWDIAADKCVQTLEGHSSGVRSISISSDGARLVSGSQDSTVRIWEMHLDGEESPSIGHSGRVTSLSISNDGTRVVSGSHDSPIKIWDAISGEDLQTFGTPLILGQIYGREVNSVAVNSVAISHDLSLVVSGTRDKMVRIWCTITGECTRMLRGHTLEITCVAISNDSTRVVSGSRDKTIRLWDPRTGECLYCKRNYFLAVTNLSFNSDESRITVNFQDSFTIATTARPVHPPPEDLNMPLQYTLSDGWLVGTRQKKLLWIPAAHRTGKAGRAVSAWRSAGATVSYGLATGKVVIIADLYAT